MRHASLRRRAWLCTAAVLLIAPTTPRVTAQSPARVIRVAAHKFEYDPREIRVKKRQTIELELVTLDVMMGFNLPEFALRTDIAPGRMSTLRFTPDRVGEFAFYCDIFCGNGHEEMEGTLVVTE